MTRVSILTLVLVISAARMAGATPLLINGNLDDTYAQEIVPNFFLPKPTVWVNEGTRTIGGAYEDEMSSEPWAGPAPTPVTADGNGLPHPDGCGGPDCAVFFKPFSGNAVNGAATGHLYQDVAGVAGRKYTFTGWAGAEANALAGLEFAVEFRDAGNSLISMAVLDVVAAGLFVDNGLAFDYKQYSLSSFAPVGTATVRARVSMTNATGNPQGGGQAIVVDDFDLSDEERAVPEPAMLTLLGLGGVFAAVRSSRRRREWL